MDSTTRSRSFYVVNPKSKSRLFALMEFEESYTPEENSLEIIVLCHGLGGSTNSRVVSGIASHLKCQNFLSGRKRAIVRFDFEANGQSDGTWDFASYFAQVEDLRAVVESLRTQGHIVSAIAGHSMGGNVVMLYSAIYGDIGIVVNVSGRFIMTDGIYKHFSKEQVSELNEKGKFLWRLDSAGREQWVTKESIERRLQISMREYSERIPGNIDVLTVHGTQDDIIPVRDALLFHESVGGQHHLLKEIEGANHFYSSDDQMIAMCQQVYNFILQKWGQ